MTQKQKIEELEALVRALQARVVALEAQPPYYVPHASPAPPPWPQRPYVVPQYPTTTAPPTFVPPSYRQISIARSARATSLGWDTWGDEALEHVDLRGVPS